MRKWEAMDKAKGVIVIIHGAMEHYRRYGWLKEMWCSSGYHVFMGDLPGQGLSSRRRRGHIDSFDEYILEVKGWIKAAEELKLPIFLFGHSMGGLVSIRLLQEERIHVYGVILSSPCLGLSKRPPRLLNVLSYGLNFIFPTFKVNSGLTVEMATRNPEVKDFESNDSLYVTKVSVRWYRELVKAMKLAFINIDKVQDVPMLVMQGENDKIVNRDDVEDWFNQVSLSEKRYKEWPGLYHEIFSELERNFVFEHAKDFVESQLKGFGYLLGDGT